MPNDFKILNQKIGLGESVQLKMDIARLNTRSKIDVPIIVSRGLKEGPCLLLIGGIHGDEKRKSDDRGDQRYFLNNEPNIDGQHIHVLAYFLKVSLVAAPGKALMSTRFTSLTEWMSINSFGSRPSITAGRVSCGFCNPV